MKIIKIELINVEMINCRPYYIDLLYRPINIFNYYKINISAEDCRLLVHRPAERGGTRREGGGSTERGGPAERGGVRARGTSAREPDDFKGGFGTIFCTIF